MLYQDRRLIEGYPGLDELSLEWFETRLAQRAGEGLRTRMILDYLDRLIDISQRRRVLVVGCGPSPLPMRALREMGLDAVGVDPVRQFVAAARRYLDDEQAVLEGRAEELPNESESQDVVLLDSVLEHVESVGRSLAEAHRVLAPGGVAYIETTNRHRLEGLRAEFNVRFFPWLPDAVKESYVFEHLHYDPSLANYTERPAVHWFTYPELCKLGREAGFSQFYSRLDLKTPGDGFRHRLISRVQRSPWLRAAALSQRGGVIFMVKRRY